LDPEEFLYRPLLMWGLNGVAVLVHVACHPSQLGDSFVIQTPHLFDIGEEAILV
jgi:hypothetical protein